MIHFNDKQYRNLIHEVKTAYPKLYTAYTHEFESTKDLDVLDDPTEIEAESEVWTAFSHLEPSPHFNVMAEAMNYLDQAMNIERIDMFTGQESDFFKRHYPNKSEVDIQYMMCDYIEKAFRLLLNDRKKQIEAVKRGKKADKRRAEIAKKNRKNQSHKSGKDTDTDIDNLPF